MSSILPQPVARLERPVRRSADARRRERKPGTIYRLGRCSRISLRSIRATKLRKKEAERRQTQCFMSRTQAARGSRHGKAACAALSAVGRARLPAFHHGSRQGDLRHPRRSSGHASWDVVWRALPAIACPSPVSNSRAGPSAGRHDARAARERIAKPPAGTALAPTSRLASGKRPYGRD